MTTLDRQHPAYTGTKEVAAALRIDVARLEAYLAANAKGFQGPLEVRQFKGGTVEPDLSAGHAHQEVRHAAQAAGKAAGVGARRRP